MSSEAALLAAYEADDDFVPKRKRDRARWQRIKVETAKNVMLDSRSELKSAGLRVEAQHKGHTASQRHKLRMQDEYQDMLAEAFEEADVPVKIGGKTPLLPLPSQEVVYGQSSRLNNKQRRRTTVVESSWGQANAKDLKNRPFNIYSNSTKKGSSTGANTAKRAAQPRQSELDADGKGGAVEEKKQDSKTPSQSQPDSTISDLTTVISLLQKLSGANPSGMDVLSILQTVFEQGKSKEKEQSKSDEMESVKARRFKDRMKTQRRAHKKSYMQDYESASDSDSDSDYDYQMYKAMRKFKKYQALKCQQRLTKEGEYKEKRMREIRRVHSKDGGLYHRHTSDGALEKRSSRRVLPEEYDLYGEFESDEESDEDSDEDSDEEREIRERRERRVRREKRVRRVRRERKERREARERFERSEEQYHRHARYRSSPSFSESSSDEDHDSEYEKASYRYHGKTSKQPAYCNDLKGDFHDATRSVCNNMAKITIQEPVSESDDTPCQLMLTYKTEVVSGSDSDDYSRKPVRNPKQPLTKNLFSRVRHSKLVPSYRSDSSDSEGYDKVSEVHSKTPSAPQAKPHSQPRSDSMDSDSDSNNDYTLQKPKAKLKSQACYTTHQTKSEAKTYGQADFPASSDTQHGITTLVVPNESSDDCSHLKKTSKTSKPKCKPKPTKIASHDDDKARHANLSDSSSGSDGYTIPAARKATMCFNPTDSDSDSNCDYFQVSQKE